MMKVIRLIELLEQFPISANARAYEGEVCGIVIEDDFGTMAVINAHEAEGMIGLNNRDFIEDIRRK